MFNKNVARGPTVGNLLDRDTAVEMGLVKRIEQIRTVTGQQDTLKTEPVKIHLKDGASPYDVHTARRVPIPLLPKVQMELQRMEEQGVIEKVTQPTDWCAPMVPVMKPNGAVRICVGLQKLNENVSDINYQQQRRYYPSCQDQLSFLHWMEHPAFGKFHYMKTAAY